MPYIVPFVASVFLWGGMLNTETGWINRVLIALGMAKDNVPQWANDVNWVYPTYVIMGIWGIGNAMLIMLAGLQGVPTELYDAAKVDGANTWKTFWNITFPMISPVIFYNLTLNIIGLFQYFLVPLVVNNGTGRPGGATMFYNLYLYKTFFTYQDMSYGSTLAWFLFLIILIVTVILFCHCKILGVLRCRSQVIKETNHEQENARRPKFYFCHPGCARSGDRLSFTICFYAVHVLKNP